MSDYRVFPLCEDGFIDWGRQQRAQTDAEALGLANTMLCSHAVVEVWRSGTCVARLEGRNQPSDQADRVMTL